MHKITIQSKIEESWKTAMSEDFSRDYFTELKSFLMEEKQKNRIFPHGKRRKRSF